jgi:hypothetical protein
MNNPVAPVKAGRPASITIICIIGLLGALITVPLVFTVITHQVYTWYPLYTVFSFIIRLACLIGLWMMKKWAAYTYTGFAVLNQIVLLTAGRWNILALIIPAVVIFFALRNLSKMS